MKKYEKNMRKIWENFKKNIDRNIYLSIDCDADTTYKNKGRKIIVIFITFLIVKNIDRNTFKNKVRKVWEKYKKKNGNRNIG